MNKKTFFDEPQAMVVRFETEDVIVTSGGVSTSLFEGSTIQIATEAN